MTLVNHLMPSCSLCRDYQAGWRRGHGLTQQGTIDYETYRVTMVLHRFGRTSGDCVTVIGVHPQNAPTWQAPCGSEQPGRHLEASLPAIHSVKSADRFEERAERLRMPAV